MLRPYPPAQSRRKLGPYEMTGEVAARPLTGSSFDKLRMSGICPLTVSLPALSTAEGSNHERATWVQQPW